MGFPKQLHRSQCLNGCGWVGVVPKFAPSPHELKGTVKTHSVCQVAGAQKVGYCNSGQLLRCPRPDSEVSGRSSRSLNIRGVCFPKGFEMGVIDTSGQGKGSGCRATSQFGNRTPRKTD